MEGKLLFGAVLYLLIATGLVASISWRHMLRLVRSMRRK